MSQIVFQQMLQLLLLIGIGYVLGKINLTDEYFLRKVTSFILNITMPAMILVSVISTPHTTSLAYKDLLISMMILVVLLPVFSIGCMKCLPNKKIQSLLAFMTMYPNVGFIGFPLLSAMYGTESILYTALITMAFNISLFTIGVWLMGHSSHTMRFSLKKFLSPGMITSLLALLFYCFHITCPLIIVQPLKLLGDMTTPLAMLVIGATLSSYAIVSTLSDRRVYLFTAFVNVIVPLLFYPFIKLCIQQEMIQGITFIILAMPIANGAVLFAKQYQGDEFLATKALFLSTLCATFTIPLLVQLLM